MILFFDTETTGLVNSRLPSDHRSQPHLVQLAALLTGDDGAPVSSISTIVDVGPDIEIPERAASVHRISTAKSRNLGLAKSTTLDIFATMYEAADVVCAHNIGFDIKVMEAEFSRAAGCLQKLEKPTFCTMATASPIVNLPPTPKMIKAGFNKPKSPKLEECISHFFNETLDGAHDALVDVTACQRLYFHLKTLEAA